MHHSEVIKLVEKYLADPTSVSAEELRIARDAAYAAYAAVAAAWAAARADTAARADADYWTDKAKRHVASCQELTGA